MHNCYLSIMARWRSRHFTAVTSLGPQEVELEHPKVVVSWLLLFHGLFRFPQIAEHGQTLAEKYKMATACRDGEKWRKIRTMTPNPTVSPF